MKYLFLFISFFFTLSLFAQFPGAGGGGGGFNPASIGQNRGGGAPSSGKAPARDTSLIYYFYLDNPGQDYLLQDTVLEPYFLQYDVTRRPALQYGHLGLPGTAAYSLSHNLRFRRGFDVGMNQFDLYRTGTSEVRYYKVEQAYTRAFFSQGTTQEETTFGAEFAREFKGNFTLSADYRRYSNEGFYQNQLANNSAVALNGWIHSDSDRYRAFFSATINKNDHLENGGIAALPQNLTGTRDTIDNPVLASIKLPVASEAQNRYTERAFNFKHFYKLNRAKTDTLNKGQRAITLVHDANFTAATYRYTDLTPTASPDFYNQFITDSRGIRHYIKYQKVENTFAVSTFKTTRGAQKNTTEQKDLLEVGLLHRYNIVRQEPITERFNEVFATGRWQIAPGERLRLNTYAHLGLLGSIGDYTASGNLSFDLGKVGTLTAHVTQQLARPTLIQDRLFTTQQTVYVNDFRKTLSNEIGGSYTLPAINFKAEVNYQLLDNYIYFDTLGLPQQAETAISVGRLTVQQNFKAGVFHLDNRVTLQQTSSEFIRIPPLYGVHSLYFEGMIFKKAMYTKIGFDLRLNSPFSPYAYQPLHGQFIQQDDRRTNWQPITDFFMAFKVKKFRLLLRYDNFVPLITREDYYFQVDDYPLPYGYFRAAIAWQFVD